MVLAQARLTSSSTTALQLKVHATSMLVDQLANTTTTENHGALVAYQVLLPLVPAPMTRLETNCRALPEGASYGQPKVRRESGRGKQAPIGGWPGNACTDALTGTRRSTFGST